MQGFLPCIKGLVFEQIEVYYCYDMMPKFLTLCIVILVGACRSPDDPATPEGAYYRFISGFAEENYGLVYDRLDSATRESFVMYLDSTRAILTLIDSAYPPALRPTAIADLSVPFGEAQFDATDIRSCNEPRICFEIMCKKMFMDRNRLLGLVQQFGTRIRTVKRSQDSVCIVSIAGDSLEFIAEADGQWRTAEVFGPSLKALSLLAVQNLSVTRANLSTFAR